MDASIGGTTVTLVGGSVSGDQAVAQRSHLGFTVLDLTAAYRFKEGQPVILYDDSGNALMRRWVGSAQRARTTQGGLLEHVVTCVDNHYLADKLVIATTYASQTAQYIVSDILAQKLAAEGVYAVTNLLTANQSDVETDTTGLTANKGTETLSRDTTQFWHGAASLKVVTPGGVANEGVYAGVSAATLPRPGQRITGSVYVRGSGTVIATLVHVGVSTLAQSSVTTLSSSWQRITVSATLPSGTLSGTYALQIVTDVTQATTFWCDGLQVENTYATAIATPTGAAAAWEVGGSSTIAGAGITIGSFISNYAQVSACLDAICQKAQGYTWWIDEARRLYFQLSNPTPAPVTITDALFERDTEQVTHGNPVYRNTQYVLGGMAQTSTQTETRIGDSHTTAFTMGYPLATAPTITLNSGAQTVGIAGVDTGKNWYWSKGSNTITQDSGGTKLVSTDTLQVVYVGQYPIVTVSTDSGGVTARQAREGGDTSGIVESVATDTTLSTATDAFQAASGYLARYSQDTETLTFVTQQSGFAQGQLATVNVPAYQLSNVSMLIESVTLSDTGPIGSEVGVLYYAVKCVAGPLNTSWVQFFQGLAAQSQLLIDSINLGANSQVAILQSGTVTFTWTVTGSATVYTLQFPSTSLYPSTTLYPGGTAGTPVSITWQKTNAGLNALRDVLSGAGTTLDVGYFAWGTGTQGTPATATQLAAEVGRKPVTSITNGASVGEEIITGYISSTDAVGVAITEVAFFAGPSASNAANSGVMLLYGLYSHTHTASEGIQVTADATLA